MLRWGYDSDTNISDLIALVVCVEDPVIFMSKGILITAVDGPPQQRGKFYSFELLLKLV